MSDAAEDTARAGAADAALREIERLLASDPVAAGRKARQVLEASPAEPMAELFLGIACRLQGDAAAAIGVLEPLCRRWPQAPLPSLQLGLAYRESGQTDRAEQAMRRAVTSKPDFGDGWLALADLMRAEGRSADADQAYVAYVRCATRDPDIAAAARALSENRPADAEPLLRNRLRQHPTDVAAMCLLADAFARSGIAREAEILLDNCLALAPGYRAARQNRAVLLLWQNRPQEALEECERLLAGEPDDMGVLVVKANVLRRLGNYDDSARWYRFVLDRNPAQPKVWTSLGHVLRTLGRTKECIDAHRRAIAVAPRCGEAYWGLASIKPSPLTDDDVRDIEGQLANSALPLEDRIHFHFAAGRAYEDRADFARSFSHYAEGNRAFHAAAGYKPDEFTGIVQRSQRLFTPAFFAARAGQGAPARDPIFVVGLPRSGSTLVEQILASHPEVEGTMELPDLPALVRSLTGGAGGSGEKDYPDLLANLGAADLRALGDRYLAQAGLLRRGGTPFFVDKLPNNFVHVGLIHLILPHARIVDVRRHPVACGLSLFKLLFGHGQHFAYDLTDIGRYYRDYVDLTAHWDRVLPGRVHRVLYESLVRDTEAEVRRLLAYCGLPFEPACLRFHETDRPVNTPSAEQVRSPIFSEGLEHWRHYEPWLGPLKAALGELADTYPDFPVSAGIPDR